MSRLVENVKNDLKNDRLLRAMLRQPVDRTPVWIMRQAGRYLPEYRATRADAGDFMTLCKSPELACKVTLQPLARFALDAAILFSDILTIPDAMGLGLYFSEGEGPRFKTLLSNRSDIDKLPKIDPNVDLAYVMEAIRTIRTALNGSVPLIGFSGSPWTLATYMVEGQSSREFAKIKSMLFNQADCLHTLLEKLSDTVAAYLNAQISAGAQAVMIFDTWGGVLSPQNYRDFSLNYMQRIIEQLNRHNEGRQVPVVLFTKNGGQWLQAMAGTGCDALGVDWTTDLARARELTGDRVALQGNLDPNVLYADPQTIHREVGKVLASYGRGSGHIFNLGHGIHPRINPDHVAAMVEAVQTLSPQYHDGQDGQT